MKMTVYYDGQFWVGVVEEMDGGKVRACRHLFGAEPHDTEILDLIKEDLLNLLHRAHLCVQADVLPQKKVNPKRMARLIAREIQHRGISTAAQEALKKDLEGRKREQRIINCQQREEFKDRKRQLAREKAKAKHRGK